LSLYEALFDKQRTFLEWKSMRQMSRSNLVILSFVFQSFASGLLSGVILSFIEVIFLWLENGLIIAKSGDPNVTSRSILACFVSLVSAKLSP